MSLPDDVDRVSLAPQCEGYGRGPLTRRGQLTRCPRDAMPGHRFCYFCDKVVAGLITGFDKWAPAWNPKEVPVEATPDLLGQLLREWA